MSIRATPAKSHADLAREWDQLAEERHRQIASGEDLSFEYVIVPTTWRLFEGADRAVVLDIGSGTGDFTARALPRSRGRSLLWSRREPTWRSREGCVMQLRTCSLLKQHPLKR